MAGAVRSIGDVVVGGKKYKLDEWTNVPLTIVGLTGKKLHLNERHPIGILRELIEKRFEGLGYTYYNDFEPVVSKYENFDVLGFPEDHPGRSKSDTYYLNADTLLRTHTSAHEWECFKECKTPGYFISADVYRRDEIDRTHYPLFHQMEGARIWAQGDAFESQILKDILEIPKTDLIVEDPNPPFQESNPKQEHYSARETELVSIHLKRTLELLVNEVFNAGKKAALQAGNIELDTFNEPLKVRWVELYFPWTAPSWEIEIWWKGEWLECCGCGLVREQVLTNSGIKDHVGWAFGVGLDRIAMLLFGIPDIRLFWTEDERFISQFQKSTITTFKPYSKYPGTVRDILYWLPQDGSQILHENDLMEIVRDVAGDIVESVKLIDEFVHPKTGKKSQCYRINYQSMDRSLTNEEINVLQDQIRDLLVNKYRIELR